MKKTHRILVVEDEADSREIYQRTLEEAGYEIVCVDDGERAVEVLTHKHLDLVLTDIRMPSGSGTSLAVWIHTFHPQVPVVVVTAYPQYEDMLKDGIRYVRSYFMKPIDMNILVKEIGEILRETQR